MNLEAASFSFEKDESGLVDDTDRSIDIQLAISTAAFYGIEKEDALCKAQFIIKVVNSNWEKVAKQCNISKDSIEFMRPAFNLK